MVVQRFLFLWVYLWVMAKNITISDDAYDFLKKIKGDEKSFSDVILSLKGKRADIMEYAGSMEDADLESIEDVREDMRDDWNEREIA